MEDTAKDYWAEVDPLIEAINIYDGPEAFLASIAPVPRVATSIYAADWCLYEIQNGGLLQFFSNSTGVLAPEALEGFVAMGMPLLAAVLRDACARLGHPYPRDRNDRTKALLVAAGNSKEAVATMMRMTQGRLSALRELTKPLCLVDIDREIYKLAETENDGFDSAKARYVAQLPFSK